MIWCADFLFVRPSSDAHGPQVMCVRIDVAVASALVGRSYKVTFLSHECGQDFRLVMSAMKNLKNISRELGVTESSMAYGIGPHMWRSIRLYKRIIRQPTGALHRAKEGGKIQFLKISRFLPSEQPKKFSAFHKGIVKRRAPTTTQIAGTMFFIADNKKRYGLMVTQQ